MHLTRVTAAGMESPDQIGTSELGGAAPRITIQLKLRNDSVADAEFMAFGYGVTIAACSVLTDPSPGRLHHKSFAQ
jgi:NifU-like protein involved in Fe-S cluster formation